MILEAKVKASCPLVSHIFFAGDSLLFLKANFIECGALEKILDDYCFASGQLINFLKIRCLFLEMVRGSLCHYHGLLFGHENFHKAW